VLIYRIGFNQISVTLVVLDKLAYSEVISLFLGLILNVIVFILLFLSIILVYSLLMINVDIKTFEMGVMRMVGITRRGLIQLLLFQVFKQNLVLNLFNLII
jgi:ABC-type antimicrobial peptide transport system permease subunit